MNEKWIAILAYLVLLGFLGILLYKVPRLDLGLVLGITVLLAGYDLFFHRESQD